MMLRAYFLLYRRRVIVGAAIALVFVAFDLMWTSAEGPGDFGVFWHHFCGCPPDPDDAHSLLSSVNFMSFVLGLCFGVEATMKRAGIPNSTGFLLTRPVSRMRMQLYPLAIALTGIALLPLLAWGLLLVWLRLVHAPVLGHLIALLELVPSAAGLGPHATLPQLASALHFGRRYVATISVGLSAYAVLGAQRWFIVSRNKQVRAAGGLMSLFIVVPAWLLPSSPRVISAVTLMPVKTMGISYLPSDLGIVLHFAFAGLWMVATYVVLRDVEM